MMRVLNVNSLLDANTGGGCAERTFQLSRAFAVEGIDTTVLTLDLALTEERRRALGNVNVIALPCIQRRFRVPRFDFARLVALAKAVDVVHITDHWTPLNAVAYLAARRAGTPHVVCPAGALPIYGRSKILKRAFNYAVGYELVRNAAAWIAITASEQPQFAAYGVDPARVRVIPNGVELADFADHDTAGFRRRVGLGDEPFVLFMGRLNLIKGPDILLDAFARLRGDLARYHLVFAGPDEGLGENLRRFASKKGLSGRVHFAGHVSAVERASAYRAADLLVVPSRQEAMSLVALEAGACGTPVLITAQCGFDEVERSGGGLVALASADALVEALNQLLSHPEKLPAMGNRLYALVAERYTWKAAVVRYADIFSSLLRAGS